MLKEGQKQEYSEWGKWCEDCRVLEPLSVFGCSSSVVVEGACVRDCRG
jgi:hypothetical protein